MGQDERVRQRRPEARSGGNRVVYWMQATVRTNFNHALEYALFRANTSAVPIEVFFTLVPAYPATTSRHFRFLLEGLRDTADNLRKRGIVLRLFVGDPTGVAVAMARTAALLVMDRGYLRFHREWRNEVVGKVACETVEVESNVVVPVETASDKEEYSAATIRRKIHQHAHRFLESVVQQFAPPPPRRPQDVPAQIAREVEPTWLNDPERALRELGLDAGGDPVPYHGGESSARGALKTFLGKKLDLFSENRNDPSLDWTSNLSPYLHFGQISPVEVCREAIEYAGGDLSAPFLKKGDSGLDALLEELVVRRELAVNFVRYNDHYDSYACLPDWAKKTLNAHRSDPRPYTYGEEDLENARTADPYWNACQKQMVQTGKMHGYMRMYWGKKIIEWSPTPENAYETALELNDRHELDGRDPNGYAGVAWCFGKHDRPWTERAIFGNVRYMNDRGLKRKFKIDAYAERWGTL